MYIHSSACLGLLGQRSADQIRLFDIFALFPETFHDAYDKVSNLRKVRIEMESSRRCLPWLTQGKCVSWKIEPTLCKYLTIYPR
jgi:hypothetical protein